MSTLQDYATRYEELILSRRRVQRDHRELLREQKQLLDEVYHGKNKEQKAFQSLGSTSSSLSTSSPFNRRIAPMLISNHAAMHGMLQCAMLETKLKIDPEEEEEQQQVRSGGNATTTKTERKEFGVTLESLHCLMEETLNIQNFDQERGEEEYNRENRQVGDKNSSFVSLGQCLEVDALFSFSSQMSSNSSIHGLNGSLVGDTEEGSSSVLTGYDSEEQVEDFFRQYPECCQGPVRGPEHDDYDDGENEEVEGLDHDDDYYFNIQTKKKLNASGCGAVYLTLPLHLRDVDNRDDAWKQDKGRHENSVNNHQPSNYFSRNHNHYNHTKQSSSIQHTYNGHHSDHHQNGQDSNTFSNPNRGEASACPFRTAHELLPQNGIANTTSTNTNSPSLPPPNSEWSAPSSLYASEGGRGGTEDGCWTSTSSMPIQQSSTSGQVNPPLQRPQLSAGLKRKFQIPKPRSSNHSSLNAASTGAGSFHRHNPKGGGSNGGGMLGAKPSAQPESSTSDENDLPEELQGLDKELIAKIEHEIVDSGESVSFRDIAGLESAKQTVMELVCWPMKRPDLFTGLRRGPNGLLLFGPPGTGKTLIGKAIACESGATFFSISSSSLTSKWIGEGEKLVRTLFAVAAYREPSVVFIDEIDSLLTQRKADENEASRRIKTEFLVQLDGTGTSGQGRVLAIGATNRPHELDDAARRRFVKRLYIPLPEAGDREILLRTLLEKNKHNLSDREILKLSNDATEGFSGADLKALCTDAALGPIRELGIRALDIDANDVPPIAYKHFRHALKGMNPSVSQADLKAYVEFNNTYGSKSVSAKDYEGLSDDDDE